MKNGLLEQTWGVNEEEMTIRDCCNAPTPATLERGGTCNGCGNNGNFSSVVHHPQAAQANTPRVWRDRTLESNFRPIAEATIKCGICQDDDLSSMLFCRGLNLWNQIIAMTGYRYRLWNGATILSQRILNGCSCIFGQKVAMMTLINGK